MEPCAVVSCHVERPLDDACWTQFSRLQEQAPGSFRIAALMRPPDPEAGEEEALWLERARVAAARGPLGHHTHFVSAGHARPHAGGPEHGQRVFREAEWLRANGLEPRFFCGGGWYLEASVARVLAELQYADCTATAFRPRYLEPGAPRVRLDQPAWLSLADGGRLLELPSTHSLGMAVRRGLDPAPLPAYVHVYFHDTDLLSTGRRAALTVALRVLARRRTASDLERLALQAAPGAAERRFSEAASGR